MPPPGSSASMPMGSDSSSARSSVAMQALATSPSSWTATNHQAIGWKSLAQRLRAGARGKERRKASSNKPTALPMQYFLPLQWHTGPQYGSSCHLRHIVRRRMLPAASSQMNVWTLKCHHPLLKNQLGLRNQGRPSDGCCVVGCCRNRGGKRFEVMF